jgi:hypothetical protein
MESKLSEGQKKMLEKIYNKIFDAATGKLTEDGEAYCLEANVKESDLQIRNLDYFKKGADVEEVAIIRFDHYKQKRYRKLNAIGKLIEQAQIRKRQEA